MPVKFYNRPAKLHQQAHQAWMITASWVMHKRIGRNGRAGIITYGELATLMGYSPKVGITLGKPLGFVGRICLLSKLPLLNVVVVEVKTGEPGELVLEDGRSMEIQQKEVLEYDWFAVRQPSMKTFENAWNDT